MDICEKLLENLNERQAEAVRATEGYVRVVAGAGSGKTRTLTRRYAYLVEALGISPANLLCVTFTNKAANEMRNRVRDLISSEDPISLICTFHGFCVKVLREDINKLKYPKGFMIIDNHDQKDILREIYDELEIDSRTLTFSKCLDAIAAKKDDGNYIKLMLSSEKLKDTSKDLLSRIFIRYLAKQKKNYALDFDDLINFALDILDNYGGVLEKWRDRLHYIQVDEFQDCDSKQFRLVSLLSGGKGNLFVVGDPDQTIYEWRGAKPDLIVDFENLFPGAQTIILDRNYRSTPQIIRAGNDIIRNNSNRVEKEMYTQNPDGPKAVHFHGADENEETGWLVAKIRQIADEGGSYDQIGILYRANHLSRAIEQALINEKIEYTVYSGTGFFERKEIKDITAYLRMVVYGDDLSLVRTVNFPPRGFGRKKFEFLRERADEKNAGLYETLVDLAGHPVFKASRVGDYIELIEKIRKTHMKKSISETAAEILGGSGFLKYHRRDGDANRLDNIAEFMTSMINYEKNAGEPVGLEEFLQDISLYTDLDTASASDSVKMMTIHVAKGLEFEYVFLCGMTEGIFPNARALRERRKKALEEERRLAYVALTRAKKRLFITESEGVLHNGAGKYPSRFLLEILEDNLAREGEIDSKLLEKAKSGIAASDLKMNEGLEKDDIVLHPVWGEGKVIETDYSKGVYSISFESLNSVREIRMEYKYIVKKN